MSTSKVQGNSNKRLKNVTIVKPIVYGSYAVPLQKKLENGHTHRWTVFVRGLNGEDISTYIKKVVFRLHESFENPNRVVDSFPFEVSETGWGEFEILIKLYFQDSSEKHISFFHQLQLYPKDDTSLQGKKPVLSDHYDELVFHEPVQSMHKCLTIPPTIPDDKPEYLINNYTEEREKAELQQIKKYQQKVLQEIEEYKKKNELLEQKIKSASVTNA
ncbi:hypothetical protein PIROE2DRAFT_11323 [Piromyces sp. E2]|nr:hypothetical protein PIROE2DRAFT_11323 [Piromyces sp. E2]|eukprot:OUM62413.1 hypothetical protein PIROE2DRAFT_11323 [Piromyces sp. E2]